MPVKFFCNQCGVEIFQGMDDTEKELLTIKVVEKQCLCSSCILSITIMGQEQPIRGTTTRIKVPERVFMEELAHVRHLMQTGSPIGEVHFPAHWNNWGDSSEKPGHIRPSGRTKAEKIGDNYVQQVTLKRGLHRFKPVLILTDADNNGFCDARWIECPLEGVGDFTCDPKRGNWLFRVS